VLIEFSTKITKVPYAITKVLYAGQVEEKEPFTYKVSVMRRHGETSHYDNMSEMEREDIVAKIPRPISSGGTARTTTLKYCNVNLLRKELCTQRNSLLLWTLSSFIYICFQ